MMRKAGLWVIAIFLVGFCLSGAMAQAPEPTLPDDLKIEAPSAGVSPRLAQLSGIWEGTWDYSGPTAGGGGQKLLPLDIIGRGVKIAIVKINPPNVQAVYASPQKTFQVREVAVAGDSIVLRFGKPGAKRTLTLSPTDNPRVADAKLEFEGIRQTVKAKLRKK